MSDKNIVITVSAVGGSFSKDLEVPLDISAFELFRNFSACPKNTA